MPYHPGNQWYAHTVNGGVVRGRGETGGPGKGIEQLMFTTLARDSHL